MSLVLQVLTKSAGTPVLHLRLLDRLLVLALGAVCYQYDAMQHHIGSSIIFTIYFVCCSLSFVSLGCSFQFVLH